MLLMSLDIKFIFERKQISFIIELHVGRYMVQNTYWIAEVSQAAFTKYLIHWFSYGHYVNIICCWYIAHLIFDIVLQVPHPRLLNDARDNVATSSLMKIKEMRKKTQHQHFRNKRWWLLLSSCRALHFVDFSNSSMFANVRSRTLFNGVTQSVIGARGGGGNFQLGVTLCVTVWLVWRFVLLRTLALCDGVAGVTVWLVWRFVLLSALAFCDGVAGVTVWSSVVGRRS